MLRTYHKEQAARAKEVYIECLTPDEDAEDWNAALRKARRLIVRALKASNYLRDIEGALFADGAHARIFRHVLAPPLSQDQFALCYPAWKKGTEKKNGPKVKAESALAVVQALQERSSKALTPWLSSGRKPTRRELERLFSSVGSLIANQEFSTVQRNRLARVQEGAVIALLEANGWIKLPSSLIDTRADLPPKHYMHKTRYVTKRLDEDTEDIEKAGKQKVETQEVDIAVGLKGTVVLAIECKVTNDETNSIKRINDVLKKAHAWKSHWGSLVKTAAVLQGVIAEKDVVRLLNEDIEVFWSHDLPRFEQWLSKRV